MSLANIIDHTALKPHTQKAEILTLIEEAKTYKFASVCVNPHGCNFLQKSLREQELTFVRSSASRSVPTQRKQKRSKQRRDFKGATEVDMVINIAALKDKEDDVVEADIRGVVEAAPEKRLSKSLSKRAF